MARHYTKQLEFAKWPGTICPKIEKKVEDTTELANTCYVEGSGDGLFLVGDRGTDYIVDMHKKTCTCCRIQKSGIPCQHVVSCYRRYRIDRSTMMRVLRTIQRERFAMNKACHGPCHMNNNGHGSCLIALMMTSLTSRLNLPIDDVDSCLLFEHLISRMIEITLSTIFIAP